MICFASNAPLVKRPQQSKLTLHQFDTLLQQALLDQRLIQKWHVIAGQTALHNRQFEQLLVQDLLAKELSLIQVAQLVQIRQGA